MGKLANHISQYSFPTEMKRTYRLWYILFAIMALIYIVIAIIFLDAMRLLVR